MTARADPREMAGARAEPARADRHAGPPASLALRDVSFGFGRRQVLDRVTLAAAPGKVTAVLGPSGCGKTTLLRLIAGLEAPAAGQILLDGAEVAGPTGFVPPERRRIGLMFQDFALFPHLSVRDNVLFGLRGRPRPEAGRLADEAIARMGLAALGSASPGQLSGGERQRVALARALAPGPRALLMDEPFSNLDRGLRERVRNETIGVLSEAGITTVMVTHDPDEALAVAEHLVLLGDGRVIQAGSGEEIYRRPVSLAAARALSEVNEIAGRFGGGRLITPLGAFGADSPGPDGAVGVVCIRPESVRLDRGPAREGAFDGRVTRRVFRGALTMLSVRVSGLDEPLLSLAAGSDIEAGERVSVSINASEGPRVTARCPTFCLD